MRRPKPHSLLNIKWLESNLSGTVGIVPGDSGIQHAVRLVTMIPNLAITITYVATIIDFKE